MKVFPIGPTRGHRSGRCRLCGIHGPLSKTHVPPAGAGNSAEFRPAVRQVDGNGVSTLGLGRAAEGGMWGYWFCQDCNGRTGLWDAEYIRLHWELVRHLHRSPELPRQRLMGELRHVDVGAFARSMWAWSFAVVPVLIDRYPEVADAVRTGCAVEPPTDVELLLGVTMSFRMRVTAQPGSLLVHPGGPELCRLPSGLWAPGPRAEPLPITVVASPPFNVVLAHVDRPAGVPHTTTNSWLRDPARRRRDVTIDLPMVDVEREGPPLSYGDLRPARALIT